MLNQRLDLFCIWIDDVKMLKSMELELNVLSDLGQLVTDPNVVIEANKST